MLKRILALGSAKPKPVAVAFNEEPKAVLPQRDRLQVPALRYPPVDPGLPASSTRLILESQSDLIGILRRVVSSDEAAFQSRYLEPIKRLIDYIHLLPASSDEAFAGAGGLLRLSLEVAVYSLQAAGGRIFAPDANVEQRHANEPRWKYATFLAALCSEIYRPLAACVVTNAGGETWPKFMCPLSQWLDESGVDRYYLNWQQSSKGVTTGAEASAVIGKVIPPEAMTWLEQGGPEITRAIYAAALGQARPGDSILADVIEAIRVQVLRREEATKATRYGRLSVGHHIEPYILDSIRGYVESGKWNVHDKSGPIYFGTDGLYLEWPRCAEAIRSDLDARGVAGVPRSPQTLAEMLGRAGAILSQESGQWTWSLVVSEPIVSAEVIRRTALRFKDSISVLGIVEAKPKPRPFADYMVLRLAEATAKVEQGPDPVPQNLVLPGKAAQTTPATAAPPPPPAPTSNPSLPGRHLPEPSSVGVPKAASPSPQGERKAQPTDEKTSQTGDPNQRPPADAKGAVVDRAANAEGSRSSERAVAQEVAQSTVAELIPESIRNTLAPADAEMVGKWISLMNAHRSDQITWINDGQVAISGEYLMEEDLDLSTVVGKVEKHGWLGRPPGAGRQARVAQIQFGDASKPGFVLTSEAAKMLGFTR